MNNKLINFELNNISIQTTPFQLLQWKHGMKLEKSGLTLRGGKKVSTHLRKAFKLKRTYSIDNLINSVSLRLEEEKVGTK